MKSGWSYYRDIDGSEVKHAPKTLVDNVYVQEAETKGLQSLLDEKLQNIADVIQTTHIADGAVTGAKLANAAVTSDKIAGEAIRDEHIPTAQISPAKIANLADTVLTTVQDKLAQVTSGVMSENELYRQVVLSIKTAMENAGIEGTAEDALRDQIVGTVRNALQAGIDTSSLTANLISAVQANITAIETDQLSCANLDADHAAVQTLQTASIDAAGGTLGQAAITNLVASMADVSDLFADAAVVGILAAGEFELRDGNGNLCKLKVTDGGKVEAVEGGISGDSIADASLAGNKIVGGSITAAQINIRDLFASEAFISTLKTYLIETPDLNIVIKHANDIFDKLNMYFHFSEDGLDIYKGNGEGGEAIPFKLHMDDDELTFKHNGSTVADINNGQLNIQNASVVDKLTVGKHTWDAEEDGSLSLVWNGVV